jgi:hypothetical protein
MRTPHRHEGRVKGIGIDCVGLPLCVAEQLGLRDRDGRPILGSDYRGYPAQPTDEFVHHECQRRLVEKPLEAMKHGDILTIRWPTLACHSAIVTTVSGHLALLHAYSSPSVGKVVEHILDMKWKRRIAGVFEIPGVTG